MAREPKRTTKRKTEASAPAAPTAPRAKAPATKPASKTAASKSLEVNDQAIRERAYQIYLARNGGPGDAHSDWQQAERELRGQYAR